MKWLDHKHRAWLLVILWTLFIFSFSIRPMDESSSQSIAVQERLLPMIEAVERALGVDLFPDGNLHWLVRKAAHFTLFMVLGALVYRAGRVRGWPVPRTLTAALLWVILAAVLDETIQTFVPGRSGQLRDVLLDTAGGMVGIGLLLMLEWLSRCRRWELNTNDRKSHIYRE